MYQLDLDSFFKLVFGLSLEKQNFDLVLVPKPKIICRSPDHFLLRLILVL